MSFKSHLRAHFKGHGLAACLRLVKDALRLGLEVVLHGVPRVSCGQHSLSVALVKIPSSQALRHENGLPFHISPKSHRLLGP